MNNIGEKARAIAGRSDCRYAHSAIIIKKNRIVSIGHNRNTYGSKEGYTIHAEVDALATVRPDIDLKDAEIWVARFNKHGQSRNSYPCKECMKTLRTAKIKTLYYTVEGEAELLWAREKIA